MSQAADSDATTGALGKKNLTTMHAVAQALAIGPMFSAALILGGVSRPEPRSDRSRSSRVAAAWTIGLLILTLIWFVIILVTRRDNVDNAATHAAEHRGVGPLDETLAFGSAGDTTPL